MSDRKLAEDHVQWYMSRLREQWHAWMNLTEKLMADNFAHGVKHGRELERREILNRLREVQNLDPDIAKMIEDHF